MPEFSAKDVQSLRQATGAGMMDAKRALQENDGDFEAAVKWLREKGLGKAADRAGREATQGAVAIATAAAGAAIVELRCETDFVAKSPDFVKLVNELAEAVAADGEGAANARSEDVDNLKVTLKENISVGRVVRFDAVDGAVLDTYLHVQNGRGVNAVMIELQGGDRTLAHEIAMHAAFSRPRYLRRDEVPEADVESERGVLEAQTRNEGKPEQAIPKIVEGKLSAFFAQQVLLEQKYVKDPKQTIEHLLGGATLTRFAQVVIGG